MKASVGEERRERVVMARLAKKASLDRSFDLDFWAAVGAEGRFAATWDMVAETAAMRGRDAGELRLQRSVLHAKSR
jgi:hypothetical protein